MAKTKDQPAPVEPRPLPVARPPVAMLSLPQFLASQALAGLAANPGHAAMTDDELGRKAVRLAKGLYRAMQAEDW